MKLAKLEEIRRFAKERHSGQFRRDGVTPYFAHCEKVATLVNEPIQKAIAYCHDLVENNVATIDEISEKFKEMDLTRGVEVLTKKDCEEYLPYIERIASSLTQTMRVKIADIVSNLSENPTQDKISLYYKALTILMG
jgi:(p)ppGpp synthase/HD superfamily hydrolase